MDVSQLSYYIPYKTHNTNNSSRPDTESQSVAPQIMHTSAGRGCEDVPFSLYCILCVSVLHSTGFKVLSWTSVCTSHDATSCIQLDNSDWQSHTNCYHGFVCDNRITAKLTCTRSSHKICLKPDADGDNTRILNMRCTQSFPAVEWKMICSRE